MENGGTNGQYWGRKTAITTDIVVIKKIMRRSE